MTDEKKARTVNFLHQPAQGGFYEWQADEMVARATIEATKANSVRMAEMYEQGRGKLPSPTTTALDTCREKIIEGLTAMAEKAIKKGDMTSAFHAHAAACALGRADHKSAFENLGHYNARMDPMGTWMSLKEEKL